MRLLCNISILFTLFICIFSDNPDASDDEENTDNIPHQSLPCLEKYQSIVVQMNNGYIQFKSGDFKNNEVMHFKIKALNNQNNFNQEKISYKYINSDFNFDFTDMKDVNFNSDIDLEENEDRTKYEIRYFDIKKNKNEFGNTNGDLLLIGFYIVGEVEISNLKEEDENELKDWMIVVIITSAIFGVVLILSIIIISVIKANILKPGVVPYGFNGKKINYINNNNIQEMSRLKKSKNNLSRQQLIQENNGHYNRNNRANKTHQIRRNNKQKKRGAQNNNVRRKHIKSNSQYGNSPSSLRKIRIDNP